MKNYLYVQLFNTAAIYLSTNIIIEISKGHKLCQTIKYWQLHLDLIFGPQILIKL